MTPRAVVLVIAMLGVALLPAAASAASPAVTANLSGPLGANGWYVGNVTVTFTWTGNVTSTSGCDAFTLTQDGINNSHTCVASGPEGSGSSNPVIRVDKTPPAVTSATPDRAANGGGWYNAPLNVKFGGADATSGLASCQSASYGGPDSGGTAVSGSCTDVAGNVSAPGSFSFKYDATAPSVSGGGDRAPDVNGWYNHPLNVGFSGSDGTSGIASCTSAPYSGPDNGNASVSGSCTDNAGNSAGASFAFKYDATRPQLGGLSFIPGNKQLQFRWQISPDTVGVTITRLARKRGGTDAVIFRGKAAHAFTDKKLANGVRYKYSITSTDEAGNSATIAGSAAPTALFLPRDGEKIKKPPMLAWAAVKGASYYNIQLFRGNKKILSIWPEATKLQLEPRWTYLRTHYKLAAGRYRWYVWPGLGARKANRYGKLLGGSTFNIVR